MEDELKARVQAGADLLDEVRPGWIEKIDPETLDIHDCLKCVLGRVFGSFRSGTEELYLIDEDVIEYGFDGESGDWYLDDVQTLTRLWRDLIKTRQSL